MKISVSDYVIKFIEKQKIKNVFTVSGGGSISLCDALQRSKKIKYVCCHHEQAASFAAEGYARKNNSLGCALVTTGPGGTNTVTGVSSAWIDSIPVIFISGQVFLDQTIKNSRKRQIGVQEIDMVSLVKPVTKYAVLVKDPSHIKYHLEKALNLSQEGRPGPVWIDIPADIQSAKIEDSKLLSYKSISKKKIDIKTLNQIKKIAKLLALSKRPIIHIGQGVRLSKAHKVFEKFIDKNKIPFVQTWNADDLIEASHPMNMGKPGAFGSRYSNFIIQNSDFYLSIGSRLPYMVTGYNSKDFARAAKTKVMVDIDKFELVKKDMNIDYKICCDAKLFISQLSYYFKKQIQINKWLSYCNRLKKNFPILDKKNFNKKKYVNSYRFVNILSANLPNSSTIVTDMGFSFTTTHQAFMNKKNQSLFTNSGHAPMGWGLPAAVGAASDYKKFKEVICLTGEGGFQMNLQELATVMHNKIPLKIFIFNNGGYLTIKQTQILGFNGRLMGSTKSSGIAFPDYSKIASSHDIDYFRIDNHKKLENKIKQILQINKPIICELMMDPNEEQIPKAINKKDNQGKSVPTVFEDMYPFLKKKIIMESKYE